MVVSYENYVPLYCFFQNLFFHYAGASVYCRYKQSAFLSNIQNYQDIFRVFFINHVIIIELFV